MASAEHDACQLVNTLHSLVDRYCTPQPDGFEPQKEGLDCDKWYEILQDVPTCPCTAAFHQKRHQTSFMQALTEHNLGMYNGSCTMPPGPVTDENFMHLP
jgi:hypothetical protein